MAFVSVNATIFCIVFIISVHLVCRSSNYRRGYKLGVVIAHNGDVYVYNNKDSSLTSRQVNYIFDNYPSQMWKEKFEELARDYKLSWEKL